MAFKRQEIDYTMIDWFIKNFPIGKHYLVCQPHGEQINAYLIDRLVAPFQIGPKHNLWGKVAKQLPAIGKKLGWVPNKIPAIFLNDKVETEIADAIAARENCLRPELHHFENARMLLDRFNLHELAQRNPMFLSEGETKILWFLTQWVKKPQYLVIGYLPASLSTHRTTDLVNFLLEELSQSDTMATLILGYQLEYRAWCSELFSSNNWEIISRWPD